MLRSIQHSLLTMRLSSSHLELPFGGLLNRAKFVYFLKIVHIFIAVLFVDAFRTAYVVTLAPASEKFDSSLDG